MSTVSVIAAGQYHAMARTASGKVYAWGYNNDGQLGNGKETTPTTPIQVPLPSGVTATGIAAGGYHSMAIGSDGKLYAWGLNSSGQIGNGTLTTETSPVVVSLPTGVTATGIAAGLYHSLAIGSDGKLYTWGYNTDGELGHGGTTNLALPRAVLSLPGTPTTVGAGLYQSDRAAV